MVEKATLTEKFHYAVIVLASSSDVAAKIDSNGENITLTMSLQDTVATEISQDDEVHPHKKLNQVVTTLRSAYGIIDPKPSIENKSQTSSSITIPLSSIDENKLDSKMGYILTSLAAQQANLDNGIEILIGNAGKEKLQKLKDDLSSLLETYNKMSYAEALMSVDQEVQGKLKQAKIDIKAFKDNTLTPRLGEVLANKFIESRFAHFDF